MPVAANRSHPETRDAMQRLWPDFPGPCWQAFARERACPGEFGQALTAAGFLSVPIPEEHDGAGLGTGATAAILEEAHRAGCNCRTVFRRSRETAENLIGLERQGFPYIRANMNAEHILIILGHVATDALGLPGSF